MSVWALLVAAGTGERLGGERPKAFVGLGDLPLLAEPLRRLDESEWVDAIVVAVPAMLLLYAAAVIVAAPLARLMAPSVVVAPVSTLIRRLWPMLPITRRRSATGLKSTAKAVPAIAETCSARSRSSIRE